MKFPDKLDVLTAHGRLISETGGTGGVRDEGSLESALAAFIQPDGKTLSLSFEVASDIRSLRLPVPQRVARSAAGMR
jgi:hypothetical protein